MNLRPRTSGVVGMALVAVLATLAWAARYAPSLRSHVLSRGDVFEVGGAPGHLTIAPDRGQILIASADSASRLDTELSVLVDGVPRALVPGDAVVERRSDRNLSLAFALPGPLSSPDASGLARGTDAGASALEPVTARLSVHWDEEAGAADLALSVRAPPGAPAHVYALRLSVIPDARTVFVPGLGTIGDLGVVPAEIAVVDDDVHPVAFVARAGRLSVRERAPELEVPGAKPRFEVSTAERSSADERGQETEVSVRIVIGVSSQRLWGALALGRGTPTARVSGLVTGTKKRARVIGKGEDGHPLVRFVVDGDHTFAVDVPASVSTWYATLDDAAASAPVRFPPGTGYPLKLDVSPGGELRVRVVDTDSGAPLIARLIVKGVDGTIDPNFGPDYRGSGAGPLIDMREGVVHTPLPAGRYRVAATHGLEWSMDAETLSIESGRVQDIELALRHVVPTPGMVGCDLHVHARPSFDAPVTVEDRVLSLVSAGVDFAVPSEHNIVGDYGPATEFLGLGDTFAHVTGVEVTTYAPRFGHFGIFPYPVDKPVPPFKHTTARTIMAAGHRGDPDRIVQVNHPRLEAGIGYFGAVSFDPKKGRLPRGMATDFDTLEVYSGYEAHNRAAVERVMADWFALLDLGKRYAATGSSDSHRIQYQWAGYPRTFALLDPRHAGDTGAPVDTAGVVAALKQGRSFVSSGPIIELGLGAPSNAKGPGETLARRTNPLTGTVRVRAAPWIDVSSIELVAGSPARGAGEAGETKIVFHEDIPSRPTYLGQEVGTRSESEARAVRYEANLTVVLPERARWVVAIVRGERRMDDALPFMQIQPLAFTNPVWLEP